MNGFVFDPTMLGLNIASKSGNEIMVHCPFHNDKNASAEYNIEKGLFYCFGCHERRNAKQLAKELGGVLVPIDVSSAGGVFDSANELDWLGFLRSPLAMNNEYLKSRFVGNKEVLAYDIKNSPKGIVFPFRTIDFDGEWVVDGLQVRFFDGKPKYKSFGVKPAVWPMNLNPERRGFNYLTEGVFGAIIGRKFGVSSYAVLGSGSVTKAFDFLKSGWVKSFRFRAVMDRDEAGFLAAGKLSLLGIPCFDWSKPPKSVTAPDENPRHWTFFSEPGAYTTDVNRFVELSSEPQKTQSQLEKFWRKI